MTFPFQDYGGKEREALVNLKTKRNGENSSACSLSYFCVKISFINLVHTQKIDNITYQCSLFEAMTYSLMNTVTREVLKLLPNSTWF